MATRPIETTLSACKTLDFTCWALGNGGGCENVDQACPHDNRHPPLPEIKNRFQQILTIDNFKEEQVKDGIDDGIVEADDGNGKTLICASTGCTGDKENEDDFDEDDSGPPGVFFRQVVVLGLNGKA
ncbi:hypothetical protein L1887_11150 [Cichorium endivia]|nr:hypothetical protein L1887_11150 [Cichorium endivia]